MIETERPVVLERLLELEGWAAYIIEGLTLNQRQEKVTMGMLERSIDLRALREIRELAFSLRTKLRVVNTELELSRGEPAASLELRR
ncbi:MAG TPA: hypothetical protein VKU80_15390 [Planctomycetota bacterium]|nr:hypothetical protein [Planctomycetota bacterium]